MENYKYLHLSVRHTFLGSGHCNTFFGVCDEHLLWLRIIPLRYFYLHYNSMKHSYSNYVYATFFPSQHFNLFSCYSVLAILHYTYFTNLHQRPPSSKSLRLPVHPLLLKPGGWLGACVVVLRPWKKTSSAGLPITGLTFFISFTCQSISFSMYYSPYI